MMAPHEGAFDENFVLASLPAIDSRRDAEAAFAGEASPEPVSRAARRPCRAIAEAAALGGHQYGAGAHLAARRLVFQRPWVFDDRHDELLQRGRWDSRPGAVEDRRHGRRH